MSVNIASQIPFSDLCKLCEKISSARKDQKQQILKKYLNYFRDFAEKNPEANTSFYPIMRLLLPQLDRERSAYGVKENTLAHIYIKILCLPKEGIEAEKLINYRAPKSGTGAGDFAEVASWVLKKYFPEGRNLSVEDVNIYLDKIAFNNASNDRRGMESELIHMVQAISGADQKWLIRMILKDMKLGMGHTRIFNAFHPDAKDLYDISNSLSKICSVLKKPDQRLHELEVEVFSPFRPMLAEQCGVGKLDDCFKRFSYYFVETKHDGERFQMHYKNGKFKYFSRNGYDYTDSYGSSRFCGNLSPRLAKQLFSKISSCIVDGEMMVWDTRKKFFRTKAENIEVKALKSGGSLQPCFCVFDVLMCNDIVVTNNPLEERYKMLEKIFLFEEGTVMLTERKRVTSKDGVISELNKAIDEKLEGIMLKQPLSVYKPNNRKAGWYKIKPEYTEGLMDYVDTIIMGGYYGEGRRSGFISHFLVGLAVPNPLGDPVEFYSFTRVGSGYTMTKLEELLAKMDPHWNRVIPGICPLGLHWAREKPDVWIEPKKSYILQIKATEIVDSRHNAFKMDYTLRFPRVEEIRYDKKWSDCMTITEFEELRKSTAGKLVTRHANTDSEDSSPRKKRRMGIETRKVASQFLGADLTDVSQTSEFLKNKEFCVITGNESMTKQEIEKKIFESGGSIVQNPGCDTFCVIANEMTLRVSNIVKSRKYNVARTKWLIHCLEGQSLLEWAPSDLISATENVEQELGKKFDKYGDSYTDLVIEDSLKCILDKVEEMGDFKVLSDQEIADMDIEIFGDVSPFSFFRLCRAYLDKYSKINDAASEVSMKLDVTAINFQFYGGCIDPSITSRTTHVIVHSEDSRRLEELQNLNHRREKKFHIVSEKWIKECLKRKIRINERIELFD